MLTSAKNASPMLMTSTVDIHLPREVLRLYLANEGMQSESSQVVVFLAPVSMSDVGYGIILPALPLQECGKDAQLPPPFDAMSTTAGTDSTTDRVGLRCRGKG